MAVVPASVKYVTKTHCTYGRMKGWGMQWLASRAIYLADGEITENVSATKALSAHI